MRKVPSRDVRLTQMVRPFEYRSLFSNQEHTLLLCVVDESITDAERAKLSEEIISAKCRYAVCWGHECSDWDTSIDFAHLETDANFSPPVETFVMTTWHDDESIEDTLDFLWMNTFFDDYESSNFAILILGDTPDLGAEIRILISEMLNQWNRQGAE